MITKPVQLIPGNSVLLSRHYQSKDLASSRDLIEVQEDDSKHHQLLTTNYVRTLTKGKFYFNNSMGIEETDSLGVGMVMQWVVGKPVLLPKVGQPMASMML